MFPTVLLATALAVLLIARKGFQQLVPESRPHLDPDLVPNLDSPSLIVIAIECGWRASCALAFDTCFGAWKRARAGIT